MKRVSIIIILLIAGMNLILCQNETSEKPFVIYSFTPQYMFQKGIDLCIDKNIKENKWLQINPQIYFADGEFNNGGDQYNQLLGIGLSLRKKIYVGEGESKFLELEANKKLGFYLAYGLSYNYFDVNYLQNIKGSENQYKAVINKFGADLLLGYHLLIKDVFSIDLYTGLGTRFSFIETEGEKDKLFDDFYLGYGYTGNLMHMGLRIGLRLN